MNVSYFNGMFPHLKNNKNTLDQYYIQPPLKNQKKLCLSISYLILFPEKNYRNTTNAIYWWIEVKKAIMVYLSMITELFVIHTQTSAIQITYFFSSLKLEWSDKSTGTFESKLFCKLKRKALLIILHKSLN